MILISIYPHYPAHLDFSQDSLSGPPATLPPPVVEETAPLSPLHADIIPQQHFILKIVGTLSLACTCRRCIEIPAKNPPPYIYHLLNIQMNMRKIMIIMKMK